MPSKKRKQLIIIKSPQEIKILRESNRIVAQVLASLKEAIRPGVSTKELDRLAEELTRQKGAIPAFKGYNGYPATLCVSVNEEIIHGIPGPRRLREGDLVSLDMGVRYRGYYGDAAITLPLGRVSQRAKRLLQVTKGALKRAIEIAVPGNRLSDISHAIQSYAEGKGFSVVREFVGHGIGKKLHEDPQITNYGPPHQGPFLKVGMVLALEPMVNVGTWRAKLLPDGWTAVTADGSLSAHFEHTIAITDDGPLILSRP
jgi:methionyl aminopeptidase